MELSSITLLRSDNHCNVERYYGSRAASIRQIASPLSVYGITHFSYVRLYANKSSCLMTTHPELSVCYLKERLYEQALWGEPSIYQDSQALFSQIGLEHFNKFGSEVCNIGRFFLIIKNATAESVDFYYFGADPNHYAIDEFYRSKLDVLESFIAYFNHITDKQRREFYQQRVYCVGNSTETSLLPDLSGNPLAPSKTLANDAYLFGLAKKFDFTPTELKCALYLCQGNCPKKIATFMDISVRTVEKHIDKLKRKLDSSNVYQLLNKLYVA